MAQSRAHALSFDAFFAQPQPQAAAVDQTPSHGVRVPNSSTAAAASRACPLSIDDIFTPPALAAAPEPSRSDDARASAPAGEPSRTASSMPSAIHIDWAEASSSEDEERLDQQTIGGQLWGPELFLAGYSTPAVWEICNLQAAQQWQCPCSKGSGGTTSCLDSSRIAVSINEDSVFLSFSYLYTS